MKISKRELRTTALAMTAAATGRSVRFTYTNRKGVESRRTVTPVGLRPTALGVVLTALDGDNGPKSFRIDRAYRTTIV